jgi:hypothetical protein
MNDKMSVWTKLSENSYKNSREIPTKPKKPSLGKKSTPVEFRMYADALETYDLSMIQYREELVEYHTVGAKLENEFRHDLEQEFSMTLHPKADLLYAKSRELGDGNLSSIANTYASLVDLVK